MCAESTDELAEPHFDRGSPAFSHNREADHADASGVSMSGLSGDRGVGSSAVSFDSRNAKGPLIDRFDRNAYPECLRHPVVSQMGVIFAGRLRQ